MYADATQNSRFRSDYVRDGTHQELGMGTAAQVSSELQRRRYESVTLPSREEAEPQPAQVSSELQPRRSESVPLPRREEAEPQPEGGTMAQLAERRHREDLVGVQPALDLGVHSAIGIRYGYGKVMGGRGSRRRRAAKVAAIAGATVAAIAGATVAGGILVVNAIL